MSPIRASGQDVELLAEFGQSHLGDAGRAIHQVEATKDAGWHFYKTQIFNPEDLASPGARRYWDAKLGGSASQLETFRENGMLTPKQLERVKAACDAADVGFLATPFTLEAVDVLESLDVQAYKVASADLTFLPLLRRIDRTGKPVFLSTGASYTAEVVRALDVLEGRAVVLLACTLAYPTPPHEAQLERIRHLRRLNRWVGYSDHTIGVETAMAAAVAGARTLEKHCTLTTSGETVCPDDQMALPYWRMADYKAAADAGLQMRGDQLFQPAACEQAARRGARRSAFAAYDLKAGYVLDPVDVVWKRPGPTGTMVGVEDEPRLVGKRLASPVAAGEAVLLGHLTSW